MSAMVSCSDFSPIHLNYIAALRGLRPRNPNASFTYARFDQVNPDALICLAASNPHGRFWGLCNTQEATNTAQSVATTRNVTNITFLTGTLSSLLSATKNGMCPVPALDYLCFDATTSLLSHDARNDIYALAEMTLASNGYFTLRYRAYANNDENMRFLVNEFSPDMNADQASEFLREIKYLSHDFLMNNPARAAALNNAIARNVPDEFFNSIENEGSARSGAIEVMEGLLPRNFAFVGDANVASNYLELSTPASAHSILEKAQDHVLYEAIKDYAMQRLERTDVWCKLPADETDNLVSLFNEFTFGITKSADQIQTTFRFFTKTIDISSTLNQKLIALMTDQPISIGDFMHHESGKGYNASDVLTAIQILVATGVACPMRSGYRTTHQVDLTQPKWGSAYNSFLNYAQISTPNIMLASTITGMPVTVSTREALVLQAINRVGLTNSTSALYTELRRIANDPSLAQDVMQTTTPTPEVAENIIKSTLKNSMIKWYAYGLLAA